MSNEVAAPSGNVPALVETPALEIGAEDVALPRLYLGQYMSDHVQEKRVPEGSIFLALGKEDPDPQVLWTQDDDEDAGPLFYVLGMRRGKSYSDGGELTLYAYDDPDAPADAWVTYNYVIALPEVDEQLPAKWLLTRSAKATARQMNLVLQKHASKGPAYEVAFRVTADKRQNEKGKYFVPRVKPVEADESGIAIATHLASMLPSGADDVPQGSEPAI